MKEKNTPRILNQIPIAIWILGFVSLLMDISSEIVHSLLPLFLVTTLGASAMVVGVIEGLAESTALIVKIFSGVLSDYLGRRKGLVLLSCFACDAGRNPPRFSTTHHGGYESNLFDIGLPFREII